MKTCNQCGEENLSSKATHCRKCGAELEIDNEPEVIGQEDVRSCSLDDNGDDAVISGSNHTRESDSRETSGSEISSETDNPQHQSSNKPTNIDPFSPEVGNADVESDSSCTGTVEIDLPEEPQENKPEDSSTKTPDGIALAAEDRKNLIADLQTKIPSLAKDDHGKRPASIDERLRPIISDISKKKDAASDTSSRDTSVQSPSEESAVSGAMLALPSMADRSPGAGSPKRNRNAFFIGSWIQFPSDVKFKTTDRISFAKQAFTLKSKIRDTKSILLYSVLGLLVILVIATQFGKNGKEYHPPLAGIIVDGETGKILPDVKVSIDELDMSVTSNESGLFVFELVPSGSYTITAESPAYSMASVSFSHGYGGSPVVAMSVTDEISPEPDVQSESGSLASTNSKPEPKYGAVKIETDNPDAEIYLDNKEYGTGSRSINFVLEGKHKLVVAMKGYERFEQTVSVRENKITTVTANLKKIQAVKREPTAVELVQSADSALVAGDFQTAIEMYSKALSKEQKAETFYKRAQLYHKAGRPGDARSDFMRAGHLFSSDGQATSAIGAYNAVLDLFPNDMKALRARGYSNINRGQYELALADFETSCNLDDKDYENQIGLGNIYSVLGKHKDAIKAYKNAEKLTESKAEVYALLAMTSLVRGKEKDARKYYEKFTESASPEDELKYEKDPDWQRLKQMASND